MIPTEDDRRDRVAGALRVRPLLVVLGALTAAAGLWCCAVSSEATPARPPLTDEAQDELRLKKDLQDRSAQITAELAVLDPHHPWAGEYYVGDGLGVNITMWLAPKSGCVAAWTGCLGLYGANWGAVKEHDGYLSIAFERPNSPGTWGSFPARLDIACIDEKRIATPLDPAWKLGKLEEVAREK